MNKTIDNKCNKMTNVELINQAKEIFKLADPRFDFRKDDEWDMTDRERFERGVGSVITINIGKVPNKDCFIFMSWLESKVINPIILVQDSYILIKTKVGVVLSLDWNNVVIRQIKTISNDCLVYTDYKIVLGVDYRDYQFILRVYKELQPYSSFI